jgi:DNA sulfur modification protein DndD
VSLLWGLARASGRPLPAVIDTPLGRLDASHRYKLIERYFPYASHQVLLLSTDEEIDEHYFEKLKPWVGHAYHLEFDDTEGSTEVKPGYFW